MTDNVVRTSHFQLYAQRTNPRLPMANRTPAAPYIFNTVRDCGDPRYRAEPIADPEGAYFDSLLARLDAKT
jgi:hypothetical protein